MFAFISWMFETANFPPRWKCGNWSEGLGWVHIVSDLGVWSAYVAIPLVLGYFALRRRDLPFRKVFLLFGAFILACGSTHLIEAIIFWKPIYHFAAVVKVFTALVSWATVMALIPVTPQALALRSPQELEKEISERKRAESSLREAQSHLEGRVKERTSELARANEWLTVEVGERHRAEHALRRANDELRSRTQEMEQFVYTVSHDLKSPLVTTLGFVGMLREDIATGKTEDAMDSVQRLERAARRMNELIDDLLQLSRIGRVQSAPENINVSELLRELQEDLAERLTAGGATLDIEPEMPHVRADRRRMLEVFDNLLINAIKYGAETPGLKISIGSEERDEEIRYYVSDNGPGIPPDFHEKIFGLFQRLDTKHEGTGVGLAIVMRVMEVHGGRVWVESALGAGATFWLAFPIDCRVPAEISA